MQPDLVLLDIGLPSLNGKESARQIRKAAPGSRILLLSSFDRPEFVSEAMDVGALGFVAKLRAARDLLPAIRTVLRGERFIDGGSLSFDPTEPPHS